MVDVVYLLVLLGSWALFTRFMVAKWREAQGPGDFEFGGAVWALMGGLFFAAIWPLTVPACLGGLALQRFLNRTRDADPPDPEPHP